MAASYVVYLQQLLHEIGHRHRAPPSPDSEFLEGHHKWFLSRLGPCTALSRDKLDALEEASATLIERIYPYADTETKSIMGILTAIGLLMDDSIEDEEVYKEISLFGHRLYLGEPQPPGPLQLYHEALKELSRIHEGDAILRGLAVTPWIVFADACLLEKRLFTEDAELRASPYDMGYKRLFKSRRNLVQKDHPIYDDIGVTNGISTYNGKPRPQLPPLKGEALKLCVVGALSHFFLYLSNVYPLSQPPLSPPENRCW
jgi:hypothetical protein